MDWSRFFHWSSAAFRGLAFRRMVILAFMAVMIFQVTGIFYRILTLQLMRARPAAAAAEEKARAAAAVVREPADAYRIIAERNLFGTTTKTVAEKPPAEAPPQKNIASLVELKGTIAGESKYGFAIIEEKASKRQRLVKAGDLVEGATVVRVNRNTMELRAGEQTQILKMTEMSEGPILAPIPGVPEPAAAPARDQAPPGTVVISRSELDAGLRDMGSLLRQAQIRPYFNAGVPSGFLISNIRSGSIYRKMGVMDGDIIQKVNDKPILTADDMTGLLSTLKSGSGISLTIQRRGKLETLNYQFQ